MLYVNTFIIVKCFGLCDLNNRTKWASSIATSPIFFCTARFLNTGFNSSTLVKERLECGEDDVKLGLSNSVHDRKVLLSSVPSSALICLVKDKANGGH